MSNLDSKALENLCINTIRILSADAVQKANSGHPGMPMGAAAMAYTLWTKYMKHNPENPIWADRDRFLLSAGHGSMLLYSLLHLTGYDLPLDEIEALSPMGQHDAWPSGARAYAGRGSRDRTAWDKGSAMPSAWRSRKRGSRRGTTSPATTSSIISPTGSAAMAI